MLELTRMEADYEARGKLVRTHIVAKKLAEEAKNANDENSKRIAQLEEENSLQPAEPISLVIIGTS